MLWTRWMVATQLMGGYLLTAFVPCLTVNQFELESIKLGCQNRCSISVSTYVSSQDKTQLTMDNSEQRLALGCRSLPKILYQLAFSAREVKHMNSSKKRGNMMPAEMRGFHCQMRSWTIVTRVVVTSITDINARPAGRSWSLRSRVHCHKLTHEEVECYHDTVVLTIMVTSAAN